MESVADTFIGNKFSSIITFICNLDIEPFILKIKKLCLDANIMEFKIEFANCF